MLRTPTLHSLRRSRFLFLLLALVVLLLVSPFLDNSRPHHAYFIILFAFIMLSAVRIANKQRSRRIVALVIGAPWLLLSLGGLLWQNTELTVGANLLFVVFNMYVFVIVVGTVVRAVEVDFDILLGAASVYLLIGIIWAVSYMVIHQLDPEAFSLIHNESQPLFHEFLYFSLTTLTTLGYGDITPLNPFAQIWAAMEAVVGTLYITLLVARLVGMYQSQRSQKR